MKYAHGCLRRVGRFGRQKPRPITKGLIRKHFGEHAKIHGLAGCFRVNTPTGGEIVVTPNKMLLGCGGDDTYRAMTMLAGDVGGDWKARGSLEYMLASIAHGEASGVFIQPDFTDRLATFVRWCVLIDVSWIGCMILPDSSGDGDLVSALVVFLVGGAAFWWMRRKARREEQRRTENGGFHFPRETTGAKYADDDECRKGGLI
jgi:hypothetical protein